MNMVTVDGSFGSENTNVTQTNGIVFEDPVTTSKSSQLDIIKAFMAALDKSSNSDATKMLDEAIQNCTSFSGINDAINHFLYDFTAYGDKFLTQRCGINLDNTDTGAITGSDAGGNTVKTASSVVPETGSINTNFTSNSFETKGLTLTLATDYSKLTEAQQTIWQALHSWWIDGALDLIEESYGSNFSFSSDSSVMPKNMKVVFYTSSKDNVLASVTYHGSSTPMDLSINMHYYNSITAANIDQDGKSSSSGAMYLDRVLAHEMTHAIMFATIDYMGALPLFIVEGMAELTHGIDDARTSSIRTLASNYNALANAVNLSTTKYTGDYAYAGGYMFLRYLAKNAFDAGNAYVYGTAGNDTKKKTLLNSISEKTINALAGNDSIVNDGTNVTIIGGLGNDTISGKGGYQTIKYTGGDGKDVVSNFGTNDTIALENATITGSSIKKNNVVLKIGKGTITLANAKGAIINVLNADGSISHNMYGNGTVTMQGTEASETLTGGAKADSLNGYAGDDTLIGGKGADTLTGGDGADVFYYNNGDGNDVITDYQFGTDVIKLESGTISKASTVKGAPKDITLKIGKGSIKVLNGIGDKLTIIDATGNTTKQAFGLTGITVAEGDGGTINAGIDAVVETIDASGRTSDVMLIGNAKANLIKAGTGNSTITTGKGKDTVSYIGGNLTITDYTAGSDYIKLNTDILSAKYNGNDLNFTTQLGTITVVNAIKKKKAQKISIIDKDDILSAQIYGTPTLTVANGDGETVSALTNTDVTVLNAAKRTKAVYLIGNTNNNTLKGGTKDDTLSALSGNDYLTGGKGNDLFIYSGGNDTISDYSVAKNNSDAITLSGVTFDTYSIDGKNAVITFTDSEGTLTVMNAKDKSVTINGAGRVLNDINEKIFTKAASATSYVADDDVVTINAAANTSAINIVGNAKNNTIKGSAKADTLSGGAGNDTLTGGKGADLFIYSSGLDVITDYQVGTDLVSLGAAVTGASVSGNDLELKIDNNNSLTIKNAIKKSKAQKITIVDGSVTNYQAFGNGTVTLSGTNGDDNFNLNSNLKSTVSYTGGNDKVTNFKLTDEIALASKQVMSSAQRVSDTQYKVTITKGKNTVGTLDITGVSAFATSAESTTTYKGEGADSGTTYYDVTSYVNIGGTKVAYNVATKVTKVEAAYEERLYEEVIGNDEVFADADSGLGDIGKFEVADLKTEGLASGAFVERTGADGVWLNAQYSYSNRELSGLPDSTKRRRE